jgi:hypothetical protein
MALQSGLPLFLFHTTVVSRWLVMPMAAMRELSMPALAIASAATPACDDHISSGSCSTHPGCGKICVNSFLADDTGNPIWSKIIARELVVPWSSARMYLSMITGFKSSEETVE